MITRKNITTKFNEFVENESLKINENIIGVGDVNITQEVLNDILHGYLECALWTENERLKEEYFENNPTIDFNEDDEDEEDTDIDKLVRITNNFNNKSFIKFLTDDLEDDSKIKAYLDIKTFLKNAGNAAISEALSEKGAFQLGMDIWLTRNHHGAGFFDHNYDNEEILIKAGHDLKEVDLYVTDNNTLAFSNQHQ